MAGENCGFFEMGLDVIAASEGPADANSDIAGDYINLKDYDGVAVVAIKAAGSDGDDIAIKLIQATDVGASGAKPLNFSSLYYKSGTLASTGTWTKITFTATDDFDTGSPTDYDTGGKAGVFLVDVPVTSLDASNGFTCLSCHIEGDDFSSAANTQLLYIPYRAKHRQAIPLSCIS